MSVHENSTEALAAHSADGALSRRAAAVLVAVRELGTATDREVCTRLAMPDMNCVRPRITELVMAGLLVEVGKVKCPLTGVPVRRCRALTTIELQRRLEEIRPQPCNEEQLELLPKPRTNF